MRTHERVLPNHFNQSRLKGSPSQNDMALKKTGSMNHSDSIGIIELADGDDRRKEG